MENVYKIKIRSDLNPGDLYPSERRYSSSIVLGLSVMFLALTMTSSLMGTLVVRRMTLNENRGEGFFEEPQTPYNVTEEVDERFLKKIEKDLVYHPEGHAMNLPAMVSSGTFIMSLGSFLAAFTGILAWKQWYIDHNITWFFLSSCFSAVASSISLLVITLALMDANMGKTPHITLGLASNIFITSLLGMIWSVVASNVAFKGMKNNYPDDLVLSKGVKGRIEVNTVKKGNKIAKVVPPDILNNFPKTGKIAKFFPKKENSCGNLPKAESHKEYEERVKKFLSGQFDNSSDKN